MTDDIAPPKPRKRRVSTLGLLASLLVLAEGYPAMAEADPIFPEPDPVPPPPPPQPKSVTDRAPCPQCLAPIGTPCDPRTLGKHDYHKARADLATTWKE